MMRPPSFRSMEKTSYGLNKGMFQIFLLIWQRPAPLSRTGGLYLLSPDIRRALLG